MTLHRKCHASRELQLIEPGLVELRERLGFSQSEGGLNRRRFSLLSHDCGNHPTHPLAGFLRRTSVILSALSTAYLELMDLVWFALM